MEEVVIKCPCCGAEYLPSEIYIPEVFFGKPTEVVRDSAGKIDFHFGTDMDLDEEFICEYCSTHFKIKAKLSFETSSSQEPAEEHVTHFNRFKKIKLEEEQLFND